MRLTRSWLTALLPLLLLLFMALPGQANEKFTYYRWVDEEGNTQFTMTPPPQGIEAEVVTKKRAENPQAGSSGGARNQESPGKPGDGSKTAAAEESQIEADPAICEKARANLETIQNRRFVVMKDEYGNEAILDEAQRQAEIEKAQKAIDLHCQ